MSDNRTSPKSSGIIPTVNKIQTVPGLNLPNLGFQNENIQTLIDYPHFIRYMLIILSIAVYAICLMLYLTSFESAKITINQTKPGKIPDYMFNPIFVVLFLSFSIAGFIYIVVSMKFNDALAPKGNIRLCFPGFTLAT